MKLGLKIIGVMFILLAFALMMVIHVLDKYSQLVAQCRAGIAGTKQLLDKLFRVYKQYFLEVTGKVNNLRNSKLLPNQNTDPIIKIA